MYVKPNFGSDNDMNKTQLFLSLRCVKFSDSDCGQIGVVRSMTQISSSLMHFPSVSKDGGYFKKADREVCGTDQNPAIF